MVGLVATTSRQDQGRSDPPPLTRSVRLRVFGDQNYLQRPPWSDY